MAEIKFSDIRDIDIDKLIEPSYNDRKILNKEKAEGLLEAIKEYGITEFPVWNENTGHIVGGAWRVEQLRKEGVKVVRVAVVNLPIKREMALNDMLNTQARDFDLDKRREKLAIIFEGKESVKWLDDNEIRLFIPETKPIKLPDEVYKPKPTSRIADNNNSYIEVEPDLEGEFEHSDQHLISFVLDKKEYKLFTDCMELYGYKEEKTLVIKGVELLFSNKGVKDMGDKKSKKKGDKKDKMKKDKVS